MNTSNRRLLIICGRAYSGKSTVARYIVDNYPGWKEVRLSSHIKDICSERYGLDRVALDGDRDDDRRWRETYTVVDGKTPRYLMIEIGDSLRSKDKYIIPRHGLAKINEYTDHNIVISDCRYLEDVEYLTTYCDMDTKVIRLVRPDNAHHIEQEDSVDAIPVDDVLVNDSLEETYLSIDEMIGVDWGRGLPPTIKDNYR